MPQARLVVLSGPLAAGKTTLAGHFRASEEVAIVHARDEIANLAGVSVESRSELLDAGAELEHRTNGSWLVSPVAASIASLGGEGIVVVDAVRTIEQLLRLREAQFDPLCLHLTADARARSDRYGKLRGRANESWISFEEASGHPTEVAADELRAEAQLVIDTTRLSPSEVSRIATLYVNWWGRPT